MPSGPRSRSISRVGACDLCVARRRRPAAAERLIEADGRLKMREPRLSQAELILKERRLHRRHRDYVDRAFEQLRLRSVERNLRRGHRLLADLHALGGFLHGDQRAFRVAERREDALLIKAAASAKRPFSNSYCP